MWYATPRPMATSAMAPSRLPGAIRDYIIKSFNDDKPYDRFIKEQLAGDEFDPNNPDAIVATGLLSPWNLGR